MKILDRYIAKNFLFGYFIVLSVMIGMFLTVDLFLNLDEFAEHLGKTDADGNVVTTKDMLVNIGRFYLLQSSLWYRDLGGMLIVIAAVFSLARMTRNNELIAVMASGVSLKRILAPILFLSLLLTGLMVLDQELLIPRLAHELTRKHDDLPQAGVYDLWFVGDDQASLLCSPQYEESTQILHHPVIILRKSIPGSDRVYRVTGRITAEKAVYDKQRGGWILTAGTLLPVTEASEDLEMTADSQSQSVDFYKSSLTADDIPIRRREEFKSLLSLKQLTELQHSSGTRRTDMADLALQKHTRVTGPIVNMIMLMVALPVLVCRDPRTMKTAILISFVTTASCFLLVFLCRLFATEVIFGHVWPAFWTWAPIFLFFSIAVVQIDSMRT
jgi:lipopolysaccharide export system permease protein